ncbi:MAG TPA: UDP-N-acetylglucosamine 2-epimerase (non-hydrolyzing) [Candidatus Hydrogenedentes bacterium]|nr:UDP-N-acetylglucosamine 2-epimerase (non-hydrolyzing) [Candidatus Hydrogenedentota bacterium]HPC15133.1 UDP-N-acetylglucosamine 2-epimerase (non-hydrolyzing) [Candidatus Hydrogenedentota bacterium]HRT19612.1 UDP-N-acetylglucosamine 2-epimerase (non-hydrolyzing) [Candidatus Hydrogenedentota bacterium]HRT64132.1 UDP-N-acetylglucosamine 2-epimerase (non-hydrolyzing) [Candidatus Hydrogenedentota bacterium]
MVKVLVVMGTRPEAIKMAPVYKALAARPALFEPAVCLTAQHRELLDQVIEVFELPVAHDLNVMKPNQTLAEITSMVLCGMTRILEESRPDVVLVHGDTTTSFATALAAYYTKTPVGHVEAGLRTHDKHRPYPEEMNRRLGDDLCDYHYAPTALARENLLRENIPPDHIVVTGNTVIDALLEVAARPYAFADPLLERAGRDRRLILVTAHRRESFGEPFRQMCAAMRDLARDNPDVEIVYPVHPNPNVRRAVDAVLAGQDRVHLIHPLEYRPFVHLLKKAHIVLTDSGGIQEEAPALGKPVLVMREVTERPEAVEAGTAMLVGASYDRIRGETQRLLDDPAAYAKMAKAANPYGDGLAAKRIADHLAALQTSE